MCDEGSESFSWSPQTWINKADCPSGQDCPASEEQCSTMGLSQCGDMNTNANNQYCSGVVVTTWTYVEAYNSASPGPAPDSDGGTGPAPDMGSSFG